MEKIKILEAIELEIGTLDDNLLKPSTSDISYWFNAAQLKYVKTRCYGFNMRRESFEQTQKRIDDLRTLVTKKVYTLGDATEEYSITLPSDYLFTLGETAVIYSNLDCWPKHNGIPRTKHVDVTESTIENFDSKRDNTFSTHRLHNNQARPLRLFQGNEIKLYTDGNYFLKTFELTYLKQPEIVDLTENPFTEYTLFPEYVLQEIIKLAAQMILENQGNPRYESYSNEINTME